MKAPIAIEKSITSATKANKKQTVTEDKNKNSFDLAAKSNSLGNINQEETKANKSKRKPRIILPCRVSISLLSDNNLTTTIVDEKDKAIPRYNDTSCLNPKEVET